MPNMFNNGHKLTPTEQRIFDRLCDGKAHPPEELVTLLPDDMGPKDNLNIHISNIRRKLPKYMRIRNERYSLKETYYVLVRTLPPSDE